MKNIHLFCLVLLSGLVLMAAGCGSKPEKAAQDLEENEDLNENNDDAQVEGIASEYGSPEEEAEATGRDLFFVLYDRIGAQRDLDLVQDARTYKSKVTTADTEYVTVSDANYINTLDLTTVSYNPTEQQDWQFDGTNATGRIQTYSDGKVCIDETLNIIGDKMYSDVTFIDGDTSEETKQLKSTSEEDEDCDYARYDLNGEGKALFCSAFEGSMKAEEASTEGSVITADTQVEKTADGYKMSIVSVNKMAMDGAPNPDVTKMLVNMDVDSSYRITHYDIYSVHQDYQLTVYGTWESGDLEHGASVSAIAEPADASEYTAE